jgi:hypothetical protein
MQSHPDTEKAMNKKRNEETIQREKQAFEWLARVATVANDQGVDMTTAQGIEQMGDAVALLNMVNQLSIASNAIEIMIANAKDRGQQISFMLQDLM